MARLAVVRTSKFAVVSAMPKKKTIFESVGFKLDVFTEILTFVTLKDVVLFLTCSSRVKKLKFTFVPTALQMEQLVRLSLPKAITINSAGVVKKFNYPTQIHAGTMKKLAIFLRSIPVECDDEKKKGITVTTKLSKFNQQRNGKNTRTSVTLPSHRCDHACLNCGDCSRVVLWNCPACTRVSNVCYNHCPDCSAGCGLNICGNCYIGNDLGTCCGFICQVCGSASPDEEMISCGGPGGGVACPFDASERCDNCLDDMGCCEMCGRWACFDCQNTPHCEYCERSLCGSCSDVTFCSCGAGSCDNCGLVDVCAECDMPFCETCRDGYTCDSCGEYSCCDHGTTSCCDACGEAFCHDCRSFGECSKCSATICAECETMSRCVLCGELCCADCSNECGCVTVGAVVGLTALAGESTYCEGCLKFLLLDHHSEGGLKGNPLADCVRLRA
jgi:hypothetical protein